MKRTLRVSVAAVTAAGVVLFAGCSSRDPAAAMVSDHQCVSFTKQDRDIRSEVPAVEIARIVAGNTAFAVDLYKKLAKDYGNTVFSPYSVAVAFGMVWGGARGQTEKEIARTLHFPFGQGKQHPVLHALDLTLKTSAERSGVELNIVNQLWGEKSCSFLPGYLQLVSDNYRAGLRLLDFKNQPEPSRTVINAWVSDRTKERIKDVLPGGGINDSTRLVLTNAIYFKGKWADAFDAADTYTGIFHGPSGVFKPSQPFRTGNPDNFDDLFSRGGFGEKRSGLGDNTKLARFMSRTSGISSVRTASYQAVELPYKGKTMAMLVIMPRQGKIKLMEDSLSPAFLSSVANALTMKKIRLNLPRFKFTTESIELTSVLESLGMQSSFSGTADFSGIFRKRGPFLSGVYHKAFIAVDEKETEAAAATAMVLALGCASVQGQIPEYTFNHPFIFLIRDTATGTVLFMGKINDPGKE